MPFQVESSEPEQRPFPGRAALLGLCVALAMMMASGCNRADNASDAKPSIPAADKSSAATESLPEAPEDPLAIKVPDGSPEELIRFLSTIVEEQPAESATDEEKIQLVERQMDARIRAAEKLSALDDGAYQQIAMQTKLESLRVLIAIGIDGANEKFLDFATMLADSSEDEQSHLGRIGLYQAKLDSVISQGPSSSYRPADVIAALKELLKNEPLDLGVLQAAQETGMFFSQVGLPNESVEAFELVNQSFKDHADPQLAKAAEMAAQQANTMRLNAALSDIMQGKDEAIENLAERIQKIDVSPPVVGTLMNVAQNLEYSGNTDGAQQIYDLAAEYVPKLDGDDASRFKDVLSQAKIRLGLIGREFSLEGVSADGSPFAWKDYAGKVVLVDFWATWCRPCIAEIPNVKENYERFHDSGFEVVGVNLDDEAEDAQAFIKKQELPWTTVISPDKDARGFDDPNAKQYAVSAIPFLVLVGRDGKVDSLHLRGPQLQERLAELLPDANGSSENADGEDSSDAVDDDIEIISEERADANDEESDMRTDSNVLDEPTETLPPDTFTQSNINPYLAADDLDEQRLVLYLLELKDKAHSIQRRPGFCDAVCDVADRIMASTSSDKHKTLAATEKLRFLHQAACLGDDTAQHQLTKTVAELKDKMPLAMAAEIQFFELEQKSVQTELEPDALQQTIDDCAKYLESQAAKLDKRHLRLASNTVELINRLPPEAREPQFERISKTLLLSPVRDVARYGQTLMVSDTAAPRIGSTMELKATSIDGQTIDLESMKGSVVLIDFWATWCGPCRKVQPQLEKLRDTFPKTHLISVNLDADEEALNEYLAENRVRGIILFGADAQAAARHYGVKAIPAIFVVDPQSRLHAVVRSADRLSEMITSLQK